jgi:hypothetical protein
MSNCAINQAIALDCIDSIGGIKTAYIGVDVVIASTSYDANNLITGMTGTTGSFYQYELPKNTGNFVETFNISNENGTAFYDQAVTIAVQKLSADKRNQLLLLSKNRNITVIFEDSNGLYWLCGKTRGAVVSAGTSNTGTAVGDANAYSITLTAQEPEMAYQLASLSALHGFTIVTA